MPSIDNNLARDFDPSSMSEWITDAAGDVTSIIQTQIEADAAVGAAEAAAKKAAAVTTTHIYQDPRNGNGNGYDWTKAAPWLIGGGLLVVLMLGRR